MRVTKGRIAKVLMTLALIGALVFVGVSAQQVHRDNARKERERTADIKAGQDFAASYLLKIKAQNDQQTKDIQALLDRPATVKVTTVGGTRTVVITRTHVVTRCVRPNGRPC